MKCIIYKPHLLLTEPHCIQEAKIGSVFARPAQIETRYNAAIDLSHKRGQKLKEPGLYYTLRTYMLWDKLKQGQPLPWDHQTDSSLDSNMDRAGLRILVHNKEMCLCFQRM